MPFAVVIAPDVVFAIITLAYAIGVQVRASTSRPQTMPVSGGGAWLYAGSNSVARASTVMDSLVLMPEAAGGVSAGT